MEDYQKHSRSAALMAGLHACRQQLQASMQRQVQDELAQDAAIELAAKLDAQRRQEDANRRAAARAQLLAEVVQGREQQIALHEQLRYCTHWSNTFER